MAFFPGLTLLHRSTNLTTKLPDLVLRDFRSCSRMNCSMIASRGLRLLCNCRDCTDGRLSSVCSLSDSLTAAVTLGMVPCLVLLLLAAPCASWQLDWWERFMSMRDGGGAAHGASVRVWAGCIRARSDTQSKNFKCLVSARHECAALLWMQVAHWPSQSIAASQAQLSCVTDAHAQINAPPKRLVAPSQRCHQDGIRSGAEQHIPVVAQCT